MSKNTSKWLEWSRELQAIAQIGLTYSKDYFDQERYKHLRTLAAEMVSEYSEHDVSFINNVFTSESHYATPKIDLRGVVFKDNKILLVKESADGLWTLPGGWADVNESPSEAVTREIYEESGYLTRAVKLLALYDKAKHPHPPEFFYTYKGFFLCKIVGGEAKTSYETSAVGFFAQSDIPPLSLPRVTPAQIQRFFEHVQHPEWPTDFD